MKTIKYHSLESVFEAMSAAESLGLRYEVKTVNTLPVTGPSFRSWVISLLEVSE